MKGRELPLNTDKGSADTSVNRKFTAGRAHEFWDGCFEGTVLNTQVRKPDLLQTVSLISQKRATSVQNLR